MAVNDSRSFGQSVQQGRSQIDARSVLSVREHGNLARTPLAAFFNMTFQEESKAEMSPLGQERNYMWLQTI